MPARSRRLDQGRPGAFVFDQQIIGPPEILHFERFHFQRGEVQTCREGVQKDDALLGVPLAFALCKRPPQHQG